MGYFLEERLDTCIRLGAVAEDSYFLDVTMTAGGGRYPSLKNGKPYREFDTSFVKARSQLAVALKGLYDRTYGGLAGFRIKSWDDFTTANDGISAYTATDAQLDYVSPGVYQLVKEYGRDKPGIPVIGRPRRVIYKPVDGRVLVALRGSVITPAAIDYTTGRVTLAANKIANITGITKAANAVAEVGANTFLVGDSVVFSTVLGMTEINGLRANITAKPDSTHITVAIDSTGFSTYTAGGTVQTLPLNTGLDIVTGGAEFDIPVAFDSKFNSGAIDKEMRSVDSMRLVEILNP